MRYSAMAFLLLHVVQATPGQENAGTRENDPELAKLAESIRAEYDLPAMGAALVTSKGLKAIAVVGVRKRGSDVRATPDDKFHLASDTKALTAAVVARLVDAGKLGYDDSLEKLFPDLKNEMPEDFRAITLKHLLTHRAGLPANPSAGWWTISRREPIREQRRTALKLALKEKLASKPGERFGYSNLGYVIVGAMIEKAADASWEDLMEREVFKPLAMKTAGFGPMGTVGKIDQPLHHDATGRPLEPELFADNPPVMRPAGGVHCSLADWGRFAGDLLKSLRKQKAVLLSPEAAKQYFVCPFAGLDYTLGGWVGVASGKGRVLAHDGSNTLNYASAVLLPQDDLAILVVANQGGKAGEDGSRELSQALLKQYWK
jgi:CubicO group peptidase (beta-lactamase class C family)